MTAYSRFSSSLNQFICKDRILIGYSILIVVVYCLPMGEKIALHTYEVAHIRLDYLLHSLMLIPLGYFSIAIKKAGNITYYSLVLVAAASIEGLHFLIPDRSFNLYDMCANLIGTIIGILLRELLRWQKRIKNV